MIDTSISPAPEGGPIGMEKVQVAVVEQEPCWAASLTPTWRKICGMIVAATALLDF